MSGAVVVEPLLFGRVPLIISEGRRGRRDVGPAGAAPASDPAMGHGACWMWCGLAAGSPLAVSSAARAWAATGVGGGA